MNFKWQIFQILCHCEMRVDFYISFYIFIFFPISTLSQWGKTRIFFRQCIYIYMYLLSLCSKFLWKTLISQNFWDYYTCTLDCGKMKNLLSPKFFPVKSTLYSVNALLSRNFSQKCVRVNFCYFHTVLQCFYKRNCKSALVISFVKTLFSRNFCKKS